MVDRLLTGWGRTSPSRADVVVADATADIQSAMQSSGRRGVIARGLGRSYNDAAQNGGGRVLTLERSKEWAFDSTSGLLTCPAGAVLDDLITEFVPLGWFVPVTPGTRMVTVGGMIAADVHGKNHHADGTIGSHVVRIELVTSDGVVRTLRPSGATADQFWATVGGMGLTGVISAATLRLVPIPSAHMLVEDHRAPDLDALMSGLVAGDSHTYSVAWIDGTPRGSRMGRGILTTAEHAPADQVPGAGEHSSLPGRRRVRVPFTPPVNPLNRWTVAAFNEAWYRKPAGSHLARVREFFHPLDAAGDWNRLYGPRGLVQYQFVVPDRGSELVRRTLSALQGIGAASFLAVLKRFGAANAAPLSFPMPGWTLAVDLPAGVPGLAGVLDALDEEVVGLGGRLYLAKDGRMRAGLLPAMYPRLAQWRAVRAGMDPSRTLNSDLARRLNL
ncbi:MAG: FAD-binding oxidoreductase [Candidatus Nanopelagicales bacterium]